MNAPIDSVDEFERASKAWVKYVFRLYVAGATRQSSRAIKHIRAICEERLNGDYELEVVDVYQHPAMAREDQVLAVPTLIKKLPPPGRKLIGDLSNTESVLFGLDLQSRPMNDGKQGKHGKPAASR
jgi:circadian clock protein KaiB